jgi:hypothetical protein
MTEGMAVVLAPVNTGPLPTCCAEVPQRVGSDGGMPRKTWTKKGADRMKLRNKRYD